MVAAVAYRVVVTPIVVTPQGHSGVLMRQYDGQYDQDNGGNIAPPGKPVVNLSSLKVCLRSMRDVSHRGLRNRSSSDRQTADVCGLLCGPRNRTRTNL